MPDVSVPAHALTAQALPNLGLCPRHGTPATSVRKRTFYSATPLWCYLLLVFGFLVALVVIVALRRKVEGAVPECGQCKKARTRYLGAVVGAWIASAVVGVVAVAQASAGLVLLLCLLLIAALMLSVSGYRFQLTAVLSKDQGWLQIKNAHPAFATAAQQAMQQAASPVLAGYPPYQVTPQR